MMISKRTTLGILTLLAFALVAVLPHGAAMADKARAASSQPKENTLNIMLGKAEILNLKTPIADVLVANPGVVDVMAVRSDQLYMVGTALGDTNLMIMDEDGNIVRRVNIHVQMDTKKLSDTINELYPEESVQVRALTDQVVLTGHVSTPAVSNSIANLVAQYVGEVKGRAGSVDEVVTNMLSVAGEQQVMLRVKILEVSRSALKDLGLETNLQGAQKGNWLGTAGTAAGLGLSSPAQLGVLGLQFATGGFGPLQFFARALEEEGILNTLAEPNLTAISGEQAGFLAGGEVPIPTQLDRNGNLVYEFRPFGVSLNFRPTVLSPSRISLQMTTEVSASTMDENLQLQGINIPSFNVRRAQTTVELPSGGTLMIAGLIQSESISGLTKLPGVGDVPVVGDLMKSDTFKRNESEVVVLITPYLVKPFAQNHAAANSVADGSADLSDIPRLSMDDLQGMAEAPSMLSEKTPKVVKASKSAAQDYLPPLPDEKPQKATVPTKNLAMAPSAGLSQQPMMEDTPLEPQYAQPEREQSALGRVFANNMKRTYGDGKVGSVIKELGSFGYITD
jgi:pilus assembly protein CpaC